MAHFKKKKKKCHMTGPMVLWATSLETETALFIFQKYIRSSFLLISSVTQTIYISFIFHSLAHSSSAAPT